MILARPRNIIILLVLLTLAFYGQVVTYEFLTFDDNIFITENDVVASDNKSFTDCIRFQYMQHDYFPLTFLTFRLLRVIFGLNPYAFHFLNLLLHIVNVILVFLLCMKIYDKLIPGLKSLTIWSGATALLFSINPLHVESVAWAMDLKDILYSMFYFSGILAYIKWKESNKLFYFILAFSLAFLSIVSKSSGITFIAILFLVDILMGEKPFRKMLLSKIPFVILTLAGFYIFGLFTNPEDTLTGISGGTAENLNPYFPESIAGLNNIFQRIVIISFRLTFWMLHSLFPFNLSVFYERDILLEQYSGVLILTPILLAAVAAAVWYFRKKNKLLLFGFLFFMISISPALAKGDIGISTFVPDRYMYLPVLGLLIMLVGIFEKINIKVIIFAGLMIFMYWSYKSVTYLPKWKESLKFYNYLLEDNPLIPSALFNRANLYMKNGDYDKALADYDTYLKNYKPGNNLDAYIKRGIIYKSKKEYGKALIDFNTVLKYYPKNFDALFHRGHLYSLQGNLEKCREDFSAAIEINPNDFYLNKNISILYFKAGNHEVALEYAEKCLKENGEEADLLEIKKVSERMINDNIN